jgi:hypothetical protein
MPQDRGPRHRVNFRAAGGTISAVAEPKGDPVKYRPVVLLAFAAFGCGSSNPSLPEPEPAVTSASLTVTPTPAPTPTPTPPPQVTGPSDVAYLGLFNYAKCVPGRPFVITRGCPHIEATATPKQSNGRDATRHGHNLTWRVNGVLIPDDAAGIDAGCVLVAAGPNQMTFNRVFYRKGNQACETVVQATLWDPQAREHTAEVTLVVE